MLNGLDRGELVELGLRAAFQDYTRVILRVATNQESFSNDAVMNRLMEAHMERGMLFLNSNQGQLYLKHQAELTQNSPLGKSDSTIRRHVRSLQVGSPNSSEITILLQDLLQCLQGREQVLEVISLFPQSQGGLNPLAACLFHHSQEIRQLAILILQRLEVEPIGKIAFNSLNNFLLLTYSRYIAENKVQDQPQTQSLVVNNKNSSKKNIYTLPSEPTAAIHDEYFEQGEVEGENAAYYKPETPSVVPMLFDYNSETDRERKTDHEPPEAVMSEDEAA